MSIALESIPEQNPAIGRPASAGEYASMMRIPADRLHRCLVLGVAMYIVERFGVPHIELVIVPARREHIARRAVLEPRNFLLMTYDALDVVVFEPHVSDEDALVARPAREHAARPRECARSIVMAPHHTQ